MALNYSHRPIFRSHISEDNLVPSNEKDIHDILPDDPFGMDISSTVTAITGWLEDLGVSDYGGSSEEIGVGKSHYPIFDGLNVWWNTGMGMSMDYQSYIGEKKQFNTVFSNDMFGGFVVEESLGKFVGDGCIRYGGCTMENVVFGCGNGCVCGSKTVESYKRRNGGFVMEEALKRFVDDGCCAMEDVVFGCGNACARNNWSVQSYKNMEGNFGEFVTEDTFGNFFGKNGLHHGYETMEDAMFGCGDNSVQETGNQEVDLVVDDTDNGSPHPAISFALACLGVRDLLAVERVCKSLRFTIQNDTLLWKSIEIDHPLNARVTDDVLLQLTDRAQGHLQCLSLLECNCVTNDGLRRVLESNPRLTKLSVPGCINIKIEGIIDCLKAFQPRAITGIKRLRVAGRPVTSQQFEELMLLLGIQKPVQADRQKPHFYFRGNIDLSCEDDRPIDLEICPKCEMVKLIYDCTTESCKAKDRTAHSCRACILCINRCFQCGRCIDGVVHEEDFFFDYVCSDCLPKKSKCLDGHDFESNSFKQLRDFSGG